MTDSTEVNNDQVEVEKKPVSKKKVSKKAKTEVKKDDGTVVLKNNHDSDLNLHTGVKLEAGKSVRVDANMLSHYVIGCWIKAKVVEVVK